MPEVVRRFNCSFDDPHPATVETRFYRASQPPSTGSTAP